MRVSVLLSSAVALAIGTSSASAMDANEIFNRLKAQAGATTTVGGGGATRGLAVSYGDDEPETAAAPKPSVVSVPAAPSVQPAPSTVVVTPAPTATIAATPVPVYTITEEATPVTTVTQIEPSSTTTVSTSIEAQPTIQTVVSTTPTFETVEQPAVQQVVARPSPATYKTVDSNQRVDLRIFFEWNSASLKPEAIGQLAELCTAIQRVGASPDNRFKIIGHTDKSGSDEYNLYLSNARAREVKRHLVEECALPASALIAVGEGERQSRPDTPANAPEERRVEIQFVS